MKPIGTQLTAALYFFCLRMANALFKTTGKRYYNQPFNVEQPKI